MRENDDERTNKMNEVSQSIKKALVTIVLSLAFFIAAASMLVFVVEAARTLSLPAPAIDNAAGVQAIYVAEKARLDYLFQPIEKMSTLLQILAAAVIGYIFTTATGPALARVVSAALAQRQQDGGMNC
jgi:hypothetical protein